ncbi:MAG: hypothetical protein FD177_809 [Desulfovibrionaceae bacterium]|nr:MAG: hypothetical protein FD177_809 [Desulfovibrionaceae bacterium]
MFIVRMLTVLALLCSCCAQAAEPESFPVTLRGKTLTISTESDRATLAAQLSGALAGEEPSVLTVERIQYDFIAVQGEGPVTVLVDFDNKGRWIEIVIESSLKQQNPVAQELVGWLAVNAGQGRKSGKVTSWKQGGLAFRFREVNNAGEDSVYGVTVSRK